ncbi:MAG TPA: hypothetical protein VHP83_09310, partial [Aggregatilineaceae bacterium]|nr:hypothetical protein [Aggregatilineaceae bacterium]
MAVSRRKTGLTPATGENRLDLRMPPGSTPRPSPFPPSKVAAQRPQATVAQKRAAVVSFPVEAFNRIAWQCIDCPEGLPCVESLVISARV